MAHQSPLQSIFMHQLHIHIRNTGQHHKINNGER